MMLMHTSSSTNCRVLLIHNAPTVSCPCVSGTILGFFVVPEVCRTRAISSRSVGRVGALESGFNGLSRHFKSKRPVIRAPPVLSPSLRPDSSYLMQHNGGL